MSDTSPVLSLPFIQPSQAQKHVTHNEALNLLDALVQTSVRSRSVASPPAAPTQGDMYVVAPGATLEWAGQDNAVAVFNGVWHFYVPHAGWRVWTQDAGALSVYDGAAWVDLGEGALNEVSSLGINATANLPDRLTVSGASTLLNHQGAGHRLKVNKADDVETASLLFQTGFSGRAEMGLAGEDDFSVKVSADGSAWTTALRFDGATGLASGAAVQTHATDVTPGRLMRADYGYGPGNVVGTVSQAGGVPTGAVVESGTLSGGHYVRFADGTQICTFVTPELTADSYPVGSSGLYGSGAHTWVYPAPFIAEPVIALTARRVSGTHGHFATLTSSGFGTNSARIVMIAGENAIGVVHLSATGRWF